MGDDGKHDGELPTECQQQQEENDMDGSCSSLHCNSIGNLGVMQAKRQKNLLAIVRFTISKQNNYCLINPESLSLQWIQEDFKAIEIQSGIMQADYSNTLPTESRISTADRARNDAV